MQPQIQTIYVRFYIPFTHEAENVEDQHRNRRKETKGDRKEEWKEAGNRRTEGRNDCKKEKMEAEGEKEGAPFSVWSSQ